MKPITADEWDGDYPVLDSKRTRFYRWLRQAGALFCGALLVCAVVATAILHDKFCVRRGCCVASNLCVVKGYLSDFKDDVRFADNSDIDAIKIGDIEHNIAVQLLSGHLFDLFNAKTTSRRGVRMGADEPRIFLDCLLPLAQKVPRFFEVLSRRNAFQEKIQISRCCVAAIVQEKDEIDSFGIGESIGRNVALSQGRIHECPLADDGTFSSEAVAFSDERGLPPSESSRSASYKKSEGRYPIGILMVLVGIVIASFGPWLAIRAHNNLGIAVAVLGSLCVTLGVYLICIAENAAASSKIGASASCYGVAENVGVMPVIVAELEFRDIERKIFAANLVKTAHDAALNQGPKALEGNHRIIAIDPADTAYPHKAWFDMTYYPCYRNYFHAVGSHAELNKRQEMIIKDSEAKFCSLL